MSTADEPAMSPTVATEGRYHPVSSGLKGDLARAACSFGKVEDVPSMVRAYRVNPLRCAAESNSCGVGLQPRHDLSGEQFHTAARALDRRARKDPHHDEVCTW